METWGGLHPDENSLTSGTAVFNNSSLNNDARRSELNSLALTSTWNFTGPVFPVIGDNSLFTARKDYIAAQASHPVLGASGPGYEGAFKTLVVRRSKDSDTMSGIFYRIAGSDQLWGQETIPGFPLGYLDLSGKKGKHMFRFKNPNIEQYDYIWITWEIVCSFYQSLIRPLSSGENNPGINSPYPESAYYFFNTSITRYGDWNLYASFLMADI